MCFACRTYFFSCRFGLINGPNTGEENEQRNLYFDLNWLKSALFVYILFTFFQNND
jgi:hypothetical protein